MSRGYNNHPGRVPHPNSSYERWSYNGYQQPPPDFYNHNNFAGPVPPYGRGAPSRYQLDRRAQHCPQQMPGFPLNPNAVAFVPRGYHQSNAAAPTMSYCSGEDADVRAYEAMYNNQFGNGVLEEYIPSQELHHEMVQSDDLVSLQEIQVGLEQILSDTDDFDSWAGAIRDRMTEKRMSPPTRAVAVHMISEMAVFVAPRPLSGNSPQHTLARLLNYLCTEIPSLLRDTVLDLLCDLHGKRNTLHPEHKINLCIFFAEVYEKIELDSGNRIDKVGEALLEQLDDLLKLDMSDSLMKTVVQLVKLCGWHLDASSVTEPLVNQLLTKMVAFAKGHPQLSEMMKNQIMSVVEVRKNGWGGNTRTNASGPDAVPSSSSLSFPRNDSGLIVGEDGVALELNEEERSFLESQFNAMDGLDDAEHDHSFDEQEVLKDFGDFVKEEEERKTSSMMEKLKVCEKDDV